jgi:hypothetical protein
MYVERNNEREGTKLCFIDFAGKIYGVCTRSDDYQQGIITQEPEIET